MLQGSPQFGIRKNTKKYEKNTKKYESISAAKNTENTKKVCGVPGVGALDRHRKRFSPVKPATPARVHRQVEVEEVLQGDAVHV